MSDMVLTRLGKALALYYLDLYYDSPTISLFIDKLTFYEVCKMHDLSSDECMDALHNNYPSLRISRNHFQSLALVAFQIMVTNDVNNDGMYDKLRDEIPSLKDVNDTTFMKEFFENGQDQIWNTVRIFFEKKNKEIDNFPKEKACGPGRYVRYPASQQVLGTSEIIKYADIFNRSLEPYLPYTFEEFKKRVSFLRNHKGNVLIEHLIFSFYQSWDGRTTDDYRRHKTRLKDNTAAISASDTVIELNEETQRFIILQYEKDYSNKKEIGPSDLLSRNDLFKVFKYNSDFQDWSLLKINNVPQDSELLGILTSSNYFERIEQKLPDNQSIYISGKFLFIIFESEEVCKKVQKTLGLEREDFSFWLLGGIRLGYREYSDQALPILCFKKEKKEIYINSKRIEFNGPLQKIALREIIPSPAKGEYNIKLPHCASLKLYISPFSDNTMLDNQEFLGFSVSSKAIYIYDDSLKGKSLVRGLKILINNSFQSRENSFSNERGFILHKQSFEKRYTRAKR